MHLGKAQKGVLESLVEYNGWNAFFGTWVWDTPGRTAKILEKLVDKGLAHRCGTAKVNGYYQYKATEYGRMLIQ